ncbi:amino acid adenylation domain-containing protein [Streptomyces sp. NPDC048416]|uniref:amino acid adenylation domain-containing protein n=1 Tax=Streptomyces sp. NPDC048416 TaxID=3365546 RepID=UPI00371CAC63
MSVNPGAISRESQNPQAPLDESLTLHENFERVARAHSQSVAVTDARGDLTYRELDVRADRLAAVLRAAGAGRDQRVGLCVERGRDLIVGLLGILKAGAGYVPVDPAYPAERRDFVFAQCDSGLVVTGTDTADLVTGARAVPVDAEPGEGAAEPTSGADSESLAYVIFTSGSSGTPKGVQIEHRNVVRLFTATAGVFGFDENDVWAGSHSAAFDFSVWEIWGALLHGGRLVVVPRDTVRDPRAFHELLRRERVTVLNQTPSAFRNFSNADAEAGPASAGLALRYVVFGGEKLDHRMLVPWAERHGLDSPALINMYGITETTVHVTWRRVQEADLAAEGPSPIGVPIADLRIDIVGPDGQSLPLGEEGVLHVAGAGLARGYLDHPQLTAERFFERTAADGTTERWYDSGDLGVQTGPAEYAYVGRADRQLKIRGYRIEPGEIEARLRQHPAVRDVVVTAADFGSGDPRLVAYPVTDAEPEALVAELRAEVARSLPFYMAPSMYLCIEEIPVTVNGKLDQGVLAKLLDARLAATRDATGDPAAGAGDPATQTLRAIWSEVLGVEAVKDTDEFFDLGGTSFSLIHMLQLVNKTFGLSLNVSTLSKGASIGVLGAAVNRQLTTASR